eukprot:TRINITY_DN9342_c0_g1_i1.p1 TRINITY_DN9342_c0_g1~~TRINITY_DN9342_c0_g1_i1.p1  ORF type:complete len:402 (-),score=66.06 TRINITY_DN9342_c0_g1_i1:36-1241(-)
MEDNNLEKVFNELALSTTVEQSDKCYKSLEPLLTSLSDDQLLVILQKCSVGTTGSVYDLLFSKLESISSSLLFKLLELVFETGTEIQQASIINVLMTRLGTLTPEQLFVLYSITNDHNVMSAIYTRKDELSTLQLVKLAQEASKDAPEEFKNLINYMLDYESKTKTTSMFACITPTQVLVRNEYVPYSYYRYKENIPGWIIDVNVIGSSPCEINTVLRQPLPRNTVAKVYVTLPPDYNTAFHVGTITADKPIFVLPFPFPHVGSVNNVRLGIRLSQDDHSNVQPEFEITGISSPPTPIKGEPEQAISFPSQIIVCNGEIHSFNIKDNDTFGGLLQRISRKWDFDQDIELIDLDFRTHEDDELLIDLDFPIVRIKKLHKNQPENTFKTHIPKHNLNAFQWKH